MIILGSKHNTYQTFNKQVSSLQFTKREWALINQSGFCSRPKVVLKKILFNKMVIYKYREPKKNLPSLVEVWTKALTKTESYLFKKRSNAVVNSINIRAEILAACGSPWARWGLWLAQIFDSRKLKVLMNFRENLLQHLFFSEGAGVSSALLS